MANLNLANSIMRPASSISRAPAGYTLLEVMLAISLITLVVGGIFKTQRTAVMLSSDIATSQEQSMRLNSFLDLLRRTFELVPGNAQVNLITPKSYDGTSEFYFRDYPTAFAWSVESTGSKAVILRTFRNRDGAFSVNLLYLDEEASQAYENGTFNENDVDRDTGQPRVKVLPLLDGIRELVWAVEDDQKQEWVPDWGFDNRRRPGVCRLEMEMVTGESMRVIYWVPVVAQPQQYANASFSGGGGGAGGGGGNGGAGQPPTLQLGTPTAQPRTGGPGPLPGGGGGRR
jgi:uncharacterized membrane protein YgcG